MKYIVAPFVILLLTGPAFHAEGAEAPVDRKDQALQEPSAGHHSLPDFDWRDGAGRRFEANEAEAGFDRDIDRVKQKLEEQRRLVKDDGDRLANRDGDTGEYDGKLERAKMELKRLKLELARLYHAELREIDARKDLEHREQLDRREAFRDRIREYVRVFEQFESDLRSERDWVKKDLNRDSLKRDRAENLHRDDDLRVAMRALIEEQKRGEEGHGKEFNHDRSRYQQGSTTGETAAHGVTGNGGQPSFKPAAEVSYGNERQRNHR